MFRGRRPSAILSSVTLLFSCGFVALTSQVAGAGPTREKLIREKVDEKKLATLAGNTRAEASAANDLGAVPDDLAVDHMLLQLKRSPQQEQTVVRFIDDLHNPESPNFHKWLT